MPNILQVLLGLALVNNLMLDVIHTKPRTALQSAPLYKALLIAGITVATFLLTLTVNVLFDRLIPAGFTNNVLAALVFCAVLAAVLQGISAIAVRYDILNQPVSPFLLLLIFGNGVILGVTLPAGDIEPDYVLIAGLARGIGFGLVLALFTMLRERLAGADIPAIFRGAPATVLTAALLSMIFMGFAGLA
jgi:electron transport complex protein RnfA